MNCFICGGSGFVHFPVTIGCNGCFGKGKNLSGDCDKCNGKGKIFNKIKVSCNKCYGKDIITKQQAVELFCRKQKASL